MSPETRAKPNSENNVNTVKNNLPSVSQNEMSSRERNINTTINNEKSVINSGQSSQHPTQDFLQILHNFKMDIMKILDSKISNAITYRHPQNMLQVHNPFRAPMLQHATQPPNPPQPQMNYY